MLTKLFLSLLEVSISISIVIITLLIFSSIINKNYIAKFKYFIWLVIAIRLLLPFNFNLPQAPVQISLENIEINVSQNTQQNTQKNTQSIINTLPEQTPSQTQIIPSEDKIPKQSINLLQISSIIWIIGAIAFLTYQFVGYSVFRKHSLRWSYKVQNKNVINIYNKILTDMAINKPICLLTNKSIQSPMMIGFIKPILLIPDSEYSDTDLYFILQHELTHYKRLDVWYKLLLLIANAIHWFNPFIYLMFKEACKDLEISCDYEVIKKSEFDKRKLYTETIFSNVHKEIYHTTLLSTHFYGGAKMMKERFANILNMKKRRKGICLFSLLLISILVVGILISCNVNSDSFIYTNKDFGFSLELPKNWEGKYVESYSGANNNLLSINYYEGGTLFTIERLEGELITKEELEVGPPMDILLSGNGYTYLVYYPSDVQFPSNNNEKSLKEYEKMSAEIRDLLKTVKPIDTNPPMAKNDEFKVVGTGYFKVEIPKAWSLSKSPYYGESLSLSWSLFDNEKLIGEIIFEACDGKTSYSEENKGFNQSIIEDTRKVNISIQSKYIDKVNFDKIINSFEFRNGRYNVIDMETAKLQYLSMGAENVFGTIVSFNMENNEPVSVNINLMKFISDPNNNYPNGFKIEDLKEVKTFPLESGCNIVPLVAPNYNTYGVFTMPTISDFITPEGKLKDEYELMYYDFTVYDGVVKQIFSHYIP